MRATRPGPATVLGAESLLVRHRWMSLLYEKMATHEGQLSGTLKSLTTHAVPASTGRAVYGTTDVRADLSPVL